MREKQQIFHYSGYEMRSHSETLLASGWTISCRYPLRLECGARSYLVRGGVLING